MLEVWSGMAPAGVPLAYHLEDKVQAGLLGLGGANQSADRGPVT